MNEVQRKAVVATIKELYRDSSVEFQALATKTLESFVESRNHGCPVRPSQMSFLNRTAWDVYNRNLSRCQI